MKIYDLEVTSNFFEEIDETSCHIELNNNIRYVLLQDTEFKTMDELKTTIEKLNFN